MIWEKPETIQWTNLLLSSYKRLLGEDLFPLESSPELTAKSLFFADFVVVSHGTEADPIFNYGNQKALELWETSWDILIKTPSRSTVETINEKERQEMLLTAQKKGYISNYRGVRVSTTGKQFFIENAIVWTIKDDQGKYCGQGATFATWTML